MVYCTTLGYSYSTHNIYSYILIYSAAGHSSLRRPPAVSSALAGYNYQMTLWLHVHGLEIAHGTANWYTLRIGRCGDKVSGPISKHASNETSFWSSAVFVFSPLQHVQNCPPGTGTSGQNGEQCPVLLDRYWQATSLLETSEKHYRLQPIVID